MLKIVLKSIVKKYWKILLSTLLISALGCSIMTGLSSTQISLHNTVNNYINEYDYPTAQISVNTTNEKEALSKLFKLDGIVDVNTRICSGTIMISKENEYYSTMVFSYDESDFQKFFIWESVAKSKEYGNISIEYNFAKDNNISVGSVAKFKINDTYRDFFISSIVSTPETMHNSAFSNSFIQMSNFGIVYVSKDLLRNETATEKKRAFSEIDNIEDELSEKENELQEKYNKLNTQIIQSTKIIKEEKQNLEKKSDEALNTVEELILAKNELNDLKNDLEKKKSDLEKILETVNNAKVKLTEARDALNKIDLSLNELKNNKSLLDENSDILKILKTLPEDTSLELMYAIVNKIQLFLGYLEEYNIPFIVDGTVTDFANNLDNLMNQIIEEKKYPFLIDFIKKEKLFNITSEMKKLNIEQKFNNIQKCIIQLEDLQNKILGIKNVKTVRELINVYNETINTLQNTIEELINKKQIIIDQLFEQNISIEKLDDTAKNLDLQVKEIDKNITDIDQAIVQGDSKIQQINNSIEDILNNINIGKEKISTASIQLQHEKNKLESSQQTAQNEINNKKQEINQLYEDVENKTGYEEYYNQILLKFSKDVNKDELLSKCLNELQGLDVTDSFTFDNSELKYFLYEECINSFKTLATFVPIIFFVVILIVVYLFMSYMIQQSRKNIGILKSIGVDTKTIRIAYSITTLLVSLGAIILGLFIGLGIMQYTCNFCKNFFPLPYFQHFFNYKMYGISAILTIIISQVSAWLAVKNITKIEPLEIMTNTVTAEVKIPFLLDIFTRKLNPLKKFFIISFSRNTFKTIFSVISIASTIILIFTSISFFSSKNNILDEVYKKRINYDAQVFFSNGINEEILNEMNKLNFISNIEILPYYDLEIFNSDYTKSESAIVNAKDKMSQFIRIYNIKGNEITVCDEGLILEKHLAEKIGAKKGDFVNINNMPIVVTDISNQSVYRIQYISKKQAEKLEKNNYETLLLNIDNNNKQNLLEYLSNKGGYLYTVFIDDSYAKSQKDFEIYNVAVWITIFLAIIIGLLIVINTTVINLQEAKRKLCMFRVLGFTQNEISRNMFGQSIIHFILACVVGFPIGVSFAKVSLHKLSIPNKEFVFVNRIYVYALTGVIVFIYVFLSHIIAMHTLKKWNIAENIKGRE